MVQRMSWFGAEDDLGDGVRLSGRGCEAVGGRVREWDGE